MDYRNAPVMICEECENHIACLAPSVRGRENVALRRCVVYHHNIRGVLFEGKRVLEIGAGVAQFVKRAVRWGGGIYYGSDPEFSTNPERRRYKATANKLPFPDGMFDFVIASQSMEHWEKHHPVAEGVAECMRVLKPGGKFLVDVPMNSHGSAIFKEGRKDEVLALFNKCEHFETHPITDEWLLWITAER